MQINHRSPLFDNHFEQVVSNEVDPLHNVEVAVCVALGEGSCGGESGFRVYGQFFLKRLVFALSVESVFQHE